MLHQSRGERAFNAGGHACERSQVFFPRKRSGASGNICAEALTAPLPRWERERHVQAVTWPRCSPAVVQKCAASPASG